MEKSQLEQWYHHEKLSVAQIAVSQGCSQGKINYWLRIHQIPKRTISQATYLRCNPNGDPFAQIKPISISVDFLLGLGIGLYWGEGTKRNKTAVRLGNTDPDLIRLFVIFLTQLYSVDLSRLRFGLQVFSDMNVQKEEKFWQNLLGVRKNQFYKTVVTLSGSLGTYRKKSRHGVLTVYFLNRKLRDELVGEIDRLREFR